MVKELNSSFTIKDHWKSNKQMSALPQDLWLEILTPLSGEQVWRLAMTCVELYQTLSTLTSRLAQAWHLNQFRQAVSLSDLAYLYHFYNLVPLESGRVVTPDWHLIRSLKHLLKRNCATHRPSEEFLLELAEKHKKSPYNIGAEIRLRLGKDISQFELLKFGRSSLICRKELHHCLEVFQSMVKTLTKKEQKALIHDCRQVCVERDAPELLVALTGKKGIEQELVQARQLGNYHFCHYFSW